MGIQEIQRDVGDFWNSGPRGGKTIIGCLNSEGPGTSKSDRGDNRVKVGDISEVDNIKTSKDEEYLEGVCGLKWSEDPETNKSEKGDKNVEVGNSSAVAESSKGGECLGEIWCLINSCLCGLY